MTAACDVAIVGSGPYALSLAAQLGARGVEYRIFGPPMKFWRDMPHGLYLKSLAHATNVVVPDAGHTLAAWCRARSLEDHEPCTMASFADYGLWVQRRFVERLEPTNVARVCVRSPGGFELLLADGERLSARRVVFATGLTHLASVPAALGGLAPRLLSHTFDLHDYSAFRGKDVAVVGAGASAIEAGALVHEAGGRAEILIREGEAVFHGRAERERSFFERARYPASGLGYGLKSRALELAPLALHFAPEGARLRFLRSHLGPAAPWWIQDRVVGKVPIRARTEVAAATPVGDKVLLHLRTPDGDRTEVVDFVIAGTGYEADVDRLAYLDPDLAARLRRVAKGPALSASFESSVEGAYFVGPIAAPSFGPLFRFVCGAKYAAPALARHLAGPARSAAHGLRRVREWLAPKTGSRSVA